jgi:hypothetical protein
VEPPVEEVSPLLLDDPASLDPLLRGVRPLRPCGLELPLEPVALEPVSDEDPVPEPVVVPGSVDEPVLDPEPDEPDCPMLPELDPEPLDPEPEPLPPPLCPTAAPAAASEPAAINVPTILRKFMMSASVAGR